MKAKRTWVVIANGMRAQIHMNEGPGKGLVEVSAMDSPGLHTRTQDMLADKPGRTFDSEGKGRHAMVYPSDPRREQKKDFLELLANQLDERIGEYDRLVIAAAPTALGELRKLLSRQVEDKVVAQLNQDLTNTPATSLGEHLRNVIVT